MLNVRVSAPTAQRASVAGPGPLFGCRGRSRTALTSCRPQRTLNPQRQINDNCPLRHSPAGCYIVHIRYARVGSVVPVQTGTSCPCPLSGCRGRSRTALTSCRSQRTLNPQRQINDNCPLRHSPAGCYIVHIRYARVGSVVPVQTGTSRPCPLSGCRGRSRTALTSCHPQRTLNPQRQINDNCPLRHSPAGCYIVHIRYARVGSDVPAKARNLASPVPCMIPSPSGRGSG